MKSSESELTVGIIFVCLVMLVTGAAAQYHFSGDRVYRQFTSGKATVITYTVPSLGTCRAVLVDGQRHAETCEGGEK